MYYVYINIYIRTNGADLAFNTIISLLLHYVTYSSIRNIYNKLMLCVDQRHGFWCRFVTTTCGFVLLAFYHFSFQWILPFRTWFMELFVVSFRHHFSFVLCAFINLRDLPIFQVCLSYTLFRCGLHLHTYIPWKIFFTNTTPIWWISWLLSDYYHCINTRTENIKTDVWNDFFNNIEFIEMWSA